MPCEARVWLIGDAGGNLALIHRRAHTQADEVQPGDLNAPLLTDLAWSSDGKRLGMVASHGTPAKADPPTLVASDVESRTARTLHEFVDVEYRANQCGTCGSFTYGFAWSPDGRRIAVTSGTDITQVSLDGTATGPAVGKGKGPLAWLPRRAG